MRKGIRMEKEKAAQRTLEKRDGELWFGARIATMLPTPVPSVVLITTDEPPDAAYDALHYIKSNEHYVLSSKLLQVMTNGYGLTEEQAGTLLASCVGTRHALAALVTAFDQAQRMRPVDRLCGTDACIRVLRYARYVLGLPLLPLEKLEQEHML